MSKKRPFVLLEILIAIALVALFSLPFVLNPTKSIIKEMQVIQRLECERMADLTFSEIKEKLLKNEIPWDGLKGGKRKPYKLSHEKIFIKGFNEKIVEREFHIKIKNEKESENGDILRRLVITVSLTIPNKKNPLVFLYEYHLFAKKTILSETK